MKQKQVLMNKMRIEDNHKLLDRILENCYVDLLTGRFHCRRCHNVVHVDWARNIVFCSRHGILI